MHFDFITLFPETIKPHLASSILQKGLEKGLFSYSVTQLRDSALDKHKTVDDHPFGGGEGMLLKVDVLHQAWAKLVHSRYFKSEKDQKTPIDEITKNHPLNQAHTVYLSPQGRLLEQGYLSDKLIHHDHIVLICGHYEGVDERFIELCVDEEISIGDYILSGGELPALVLVDALVRLIPGVLGNDVSVPNDSIQRGNLKYSQYTRPQKYLDHEVPEVLLSGDHKKIEKWRLENSKAQTKKKRPDLLEKKK